MACVGPGRDASLALCRGAFAIPNEIPDSLSRIEKGHEKGELFGDPFNVPRSKLYRSKRAADPSDRASCGGRHGVRRRPMRAPNCE